MIGRFLSVSFTNTYRTTRDCIRVYVRRVYLNFLILKNVLLTQYGPHSTANVL